MSTYDITTTTIDTSGLAAGDIINCPYSGAKKSITLPKGKYKIEVWGAMGGYRSSATYAGKGGYSVGTLTLEKATELFLYAGGAGNTQTAYYSSPIYEGGFNGGGRRYSYKGGGGASDVRVGQDSLYARVIVAGGGGSDGASSKKGMYGGGTAGGDATEYYGSIGYGGTQTGCSGGSTYVATAQATAATSQANTYCGFGFGGTGVYRSSGYGGAGGGGWYGGCGAYPDGSGDDDRGGGGGSGYIYTSDTAANYPSGCLLDSSHYLSDATMIAGNASMTLPGGTTATGNNSDGYVRITIIEIETMKVYVKIGGEWKKANTIYGKIGGSWKKASGIFSNIGKTWKK